MRIFILVFFLFFFLPSFFWDDDEKNLHQMHQKAEAALQEKQFAEARDVYEELLNKISISSLQKYHLTWETYIDMHLRLAKAYQGLEEPEKGEKLLTDLLAIHPPSEFTTRIKLELAHLLPFPGESYALLHSLQGTLPINEWGKQERSLFHALEYNLNSYYDGLITKANCQFVAKQYKEALTLFEEVSEGIENKFYPKAIDPASVIPQKIKYRLADCYYREKLYEKSLSLMQEPNEKVDPEMVYLAAMCYREKAEFEKALELFQKYASSERSDLDHYEHSLLEIGLAHYRAKQYEKALPYFERLQTGKKKGKVSLVAALYLSKIHLHQKDFAKVETLLAPLKPDLTTRDALLGESLYLRGDAAFHLEHFSEAKKHFETSLKIKDSSIWKTSALYYLGWCHLKLAEFTEAEQTFKRVLKITESVDPFHEKTRLALAHLELCRAPHPSLDSFFSQEETKILSFAGAREWLLIKAEAAATFAQREKIYSELTEVHDPHFAKGWYMRGMNYFKEGLLDQPKRTYLFERAVAAFEKALLERKCAEESFDPMISTSLLSEPTEEFVYLKSLIFAHLNDFHQADDCLSQMLETFPQGKYAAPALYMRGTLQFRQGEFKKAFENFLTVVTRFPQSPLISEGLYWAGEAGTKLEEDVVSLRRQLYENYPDSPQAAAAYFKTFPFFFYSNGDATALAHLKDFPRRFPDSPLLVVVHCLIGIHEKHFDESKARLEAAMVAYEKHDTQCIYRNFFYLARLKTAQIYLFDSRDLAKCEGLLHRLIGEFSSEPEAHYPLLYQESEFTLAKCYLKQGRTRDAERVFATMLDHFSRAGINVGYFFSLLWHEQGKLALECKDNKTALQCFSIADEAGKDLLSDEEKLALWISESTGYREKGDLDRAMRLLSKVINADVASSLRLEAMYLRAEIYEMQGRPELALRQLEAAAKKGGNRGI